MTALAPITPAALADILATDARTTRKFLRSITPAEDRPGKGSRWEIKATKTNLASLAKKFAAFQANEAEAKAKRAAKAEVTEADIDNAGLTLVDPDEVITDEDFAAEVEGPTDADLEAIDAE